MKNPPFTYHRPESLDEALDLLATLEDAKVLAGGQSLLPVMALRLGRPEHVIDISRISALSNVAAGPDGLSIGAMVRHAEAEHSPIVAERAPLVAAALPHVGHRAIRNRGTVVGSIAHADAAAEMPAVCLVAEATMRIASTRGTREVPAAEFFQGYFTTALEHDELLTEVHFPAWPSTASGTVVEISRRHGDYAMCGLACGIDVRNGSIERAGLAFFGVSSLPVRVPEAEAALVGQAPSATAFAQAASIVSATLEPDTDLHATAEYRKHIAGVLTRRGLAEAAQLQGVAA